MILEYANGENFLSANYSPRTVGPTFFEKRLPVMTLLQHAAYAEYKEVDAMLTKNPLLLLEEDTVTDYSDRTHSKRTVYQLALGAVDRDLFTDKGKKVVDGMVEMIEKHFSRLPDKTADEINQIMQAQYKGQFPEGWEAEEKKRVQKDSAALHAAMNVIKKASDDNCKKTSALEDNIHIILHEKEDKEGKKESLRAIELKRIVQPIMKARDEKEFEAAFNELKNYVNRKGLIKNDFNFAVLKAIYQFRNYLEPKGVMTSGTHFNHQLLAEGATQYGEHFVNFGNRWNSPKNLLCFQKVFGYIERFVPACDAELIAQGLWEIFKAGNPSRRSLAFLLSECQYFPLASDPAWEIGYNCAYMPAWRGDGAEPECFVSLFSQNLYQAKTAALQNLCNVQTTNQKRAVV